MNSIIHQPNDAVLIYISSTWPLINGGGPLAVKSSLELYNRYFSHVYFLGLEEYDCPNKEEFERQQKVTIHHVPIIREAKWARFAKSLFSPYPALIYQFRQPRIIEQVLNIIEQIIPKNKKVAIIIEDVPLAYLLEFIVRYYPNIPTAVRSQNIISKAFDGFDKEGLFASRIAWSYELSKIRNFEKNARKMADKFWAISNQDEKDYMERLEIACDGILGIDVETERYSLVSYGSLSNVINIGRVDLRKGAGLSKFIDECWKRILQKNNRASLVLAGHGTENYTNKVNHIIGLGAVGDDRELLNQGMIFVNPQYIGSGIKIKTIIAMLAGKAVITTPVGSEGIPGVSGEHFIVVDSFEYFAEAVIDLMNNEKRAIEIGRKARELATHVYSKQNFESQAVKLLDDLLSDKVTI